MAQLEEITYSNRKPLRLFHFIFYFFFYYFIFNSYSYYYVFRKEDTSIGIFFGLFAIIFSICSLHSTTKQINEQQIDYWNARGIDDNRKGAEFLKQRENVKAALAYKNAIDAFDKAEELDPLYAKTWSNKGNALVAQMEYDEAIEALRHATELDSQSPRTWTNYGLGLYEKGKALHKQGDFLHSLGKHDEAIRAFDRAKELDSEASLAWNGKGAALKDKGDFSRAKAITKNSGTIFHMLITCMMAPSDVITRLSS